MEVELLVGGVFRLRAEYEEDILQVQQTHIGRKGRSTNERRSEVSGKNDRSRLVNTEVESQDGRLGQRLVENWKWSRMFCLR